MTDIFADDTLQHSGDMVSDVLMQINPQLYVSPSYRPVDYLREGEKGFYASFEYAYCVKVTIVLDAEHVDSFFEHLKHTAIGFRSLGGDLGFIVPKHLFFDEYDLCQITFFIHFDYIRRNYAFYTQLRGFAALPRIVILNKVDDDGYLDYIRDYNDFFFKEENVIDYFRFYGALTKRRVRCELQEQITHEISRKIRGRSLDRKNAGSDAR